MANRPFSSISQQILNPTGQHSAFMASRARIKSQLDFIFIKLLRKYRKEFFCVPYVDDDTKNLYFYVSVPSESFYLNKIHWDCIIEVDYDSSQSIESRNAKYFCNSPDFIYTYAYVFNKHDMLPDFIKSQMPIECLTMPPSQRNPIESFGFQKNLYCALKYLTVGGCLTDSYISSYRQRWNTMSMNQLVNRIADTATLVSVYQHAKRLDALKHKTNKKPVSDRQKTAMTKEIGNYVKNRKANTPNYVGFIIRRAPRSKITARKAIKAISKRGPKKKVTSTF